MFLIACISFSLETRINDIFGIDYSLTRKGKVRRGSVKSINRRSRKK